MSLLIYRKTAGNALPSSLSDRHICCLDCGAVNDIGIRHVFKRLFDSTVLLEPKNVSDFLFQLILGNAGFFLQVGLSAGI